MEITTNTAIISGTIASDFTFSHQVYSENFYNFFLECPRLSGTGDILPMTISERLMTQNFKQGDFIEVNGQVRSYNSYVDGRTKLVLTVFVRDIYACDSEPAENFIELNGFICKPCVYRTTPFGRKIADILLAVNRNYNKSDYIPCICWGRNAIFANTLNIGDNIKISGRMQSRIYQKKLSETEIIEKTAYEISISKIENLTNDVKNNE